MTTHQWVFDSETETDNVWRCTECGTPCGFNKPGVGEPSATSTEFPEDIDKYVGVCPKLAEPKTEVQDLRETVRALSAAVLGGVDTAQLVTDGKLTAEQRKKLVDVDAATKAQASIDINARA